MHRGRTILARVFLLILSLLALPIVAAADTIYVDQDAPGPIHDGSSWCRAFTQLYEALRIAFPGEMICIADGVYLPDTTGLVNPRDATFGIGADITLAGAYAGCGAPDPNERDPFIYITALSGDLARDDPDGGVTDNAYHVVTAPAMTGSAATLSGLVIRGGNAESGRGGGILSDGGRLVLSICTLKNNRAWRGGAIYIEAGELHLFQCRITDNVTSGEGGAIFDAASDLEARNCIFALNAAGSDGGAIFSDLRSSDFFCCSFGGNVSEGRGGAIYDYVAVYTTTGNCIFWGNSDTSGSGENAQIYINPSNTLMIDYSCVQGWTGGFGGEGNIGDDPLLADLPSGDMHLLPDSPCIDRGSNELVGSQLDLDGNLRIVNGIVDMGCYEFQGSSGLPPSWDASDSPRILGIEAPAGREMIAVHFLPPRDGAWSLAVYSIAGRRVRQLDRGIGGFGRQCRIWDRRDTAGRPVPSGVYFYALTQDRRLLDVAKEILLP